MTFDALTPDARFMRDQESTFLANHSDEQLKTAYLTSAKGELLDDLQSALSLDVGSDDDMAVLDGYIDDHADRMTRTLSTLMLVYRFQNEYMGQGAAMNLEKLDYWRKRYAELKRGFPALSTVRGTAESYSILIQK